MIVFNPANPKKEICQETDQALEKLQGHRFRLHSPRFTWDINHRTLIIGVLNITPDSFSDGGKFMEPRIAIERALEMREEGADIIDIGAESTRPGSDPVSSQEELNRLLPVIRPLVKLGHIPISVDTYKSEVAKIMLDEGVDMINDISGFTFDCHMPEALAPHNVPVIIMHTPGPPKTMQQNIKYRALIPDILLFLRQAIEMGKKAGINQERFIIDPGIGFGKTGAQNLAIIRLLSDFRSLGRPIMIGVSRKSFIGKILDLPPEERIEGTAAAVVVSILNGANLIRVHDVKAMTRVAKMADALKS
ncbi:MAG: dihydropteroate synthase [Candidatus Tectomicrobia bacterium]|uniref:Dihydropteroate synthase n=1 Tax=Tectimicrobiota bacterium TaxID=2528274 RepID=A0A933GL20_UNCTE|nr:dihydropteroate synthase [Candidatus Tectomicrobia bacterium]